MTQTKAQSLGITEFPYIIKDSLGNETYFETEHGNWRKSEYDDAGNQTSYETSYGYWWKATYELKDSELHRVVYKTSSLITWRSMFRVMPVPSKYYISDKFKKILNGNINHVFCEDVEGKWCEYTYSGTEITYTNEIYDQKSVYDSDGNLILVENRNTGFWEKYQYDQFGNRIRIYNSIGDVYTMTYDDRGNQISFESSDGYWRRAEYDNNNNIINKLSGQK